MTSPVDPVEVRRQSVSPKLPDFKRMSGFGLDLNMFDTKQGGRPGEPIPAAASESAARSAVTPSQEDPAPTNQTLHKEPSLGFTSVVHQAFDRDSDNSSLPVSPASRSGSGYRRSDTESTSGISPIVSRVSSVTMPETRNRDVIPLVIPESIEERVAPAEAAPEQTPDSNLEQRTAGVEAVGEFKPGHRRDLSIPSPGNSVAKTADVSNSEQLPESQQAVMTEDDGQDIESETSKKESSTHEAPRIQEDPRAGELTAPVAAEAAELEQSSGPGQEGEPHEGLRTDDPLNQLLPTPDPAMAPSGNIYSHPLDPRVTSGPETISSNNQPLPSVTVTGRESSSSVVG